MFRLGSARSATFVLLLASIEPRSFISGSKVDLAAVLQAFNRHEFHHMYPRAPLRDDGVTANNINCLANMCILSRADNKVVTALARIAPRSSCLEVVCEQRLLQEERAQMVADIAANLIA